MLLINVEKNHEGRSPYAFTLIELLVVIAILGVLMAILIPAIGGVREQAKISQSVSNLKQIGVSAQLYRQDNNDKFPVHRDNAGQLWIDQLWEYSNPGQERIRLTATSGPEILKNTIYYTPMVEDNLRARSFGYNYVIDQAFANRLYGFGDAAKIALVADSKNSSSLSVNQINYRNKEQAHVLFVDGHVESRTIETVPESHQSVFWRGLVPDS